MYVGSKPRCGGQQHLRFRLRAEKYRAIQREGSLPGGNAWAISYFRRSHFSPFCRSFSTPSSPRCLGRSRLKTDTKPKNDIEIFLGFYLSLSLTRTFLGRGRMHSGRNDSPLRRSQHDNIHFSSRDCFSVVFCKRMYPFLGQVSFLLRISHLGRGDICTYPSHHSMYLSLSPLLLSLSAQFFWFLDLGDLILVVQ